MKRISTTVLWRGYVSPQEVYYALRRLRDLRRRVLVSIDPFSKEFGEEALVYGFNRITLVL